MAEDQLRKAHNSRDLWLALGLSLFAAIAFYFSTKATLHDLDYTNQIASALLHGQLGLQEKPPDWLERDDSVGRQILLSLSAGSSA